MTRRDFLTSKTYHLTCGPARCVEMVRALLERRAAIIDPNDPACLSMMSIPIFVWRPLPCSCTPSEILKFYEALKVVDVISPNFADVMALFDVKPRATTFDQLIALRDGCNRLLALGFGNKPSAVVVRNGEQGCYIATLQRHTAMPAYYKLPNLLSPEERIVRAQKVVDTAGAGDSFLGGFCIGILNDPHPLGLTEFEVGAIYGSVAASFAIEQVGLPRMDYHWLPSQTTKKECWNGEAVRKRLTEFERRIELPRLSKPEQMRASLYRNIPIIKKSFEDPGGPTNRRIRKCYYWGNERMDLKLGSFGV